MVENGIYIIKQSYFEKFEQYGCKFKDNKSGRRPTFCCLQDKYIKEIFWAIPTSEITKDKNMNRIDKYIEREYIVNGKHLVLRNEEQNKAIRKKLIRILNAEKLNPNRFEQKITFIKDKLIDELF